MVADDISDISQPIRLEPKSSGSLFGNWVGIIHSNSRNYLSNYNVSYCNVKFMYAACQSQVCIIAL